MNAKILVADDGEFVGDVLKAMLVESEMERTSDQASIRITEVIEASDGQEAVEVFMRDSPDPVLMGNVMPGMDGIEATRRIMAKDPDAIVLAITAFSSTKGREMLSRRARSSPSR